METGKRIKAIREKLGLTQQALAKRLGVSRSYLAGIETEKKAPSRQFLKSLMETTGTSADWVLTGHGNSEVSADGSPQEFSDFRSDLKTTDGTGAVHGTGDDSGTYGKSERSDFSAATFPTSTQKVGTTRPDPTVPLDLEGPVDLRMVRLVVELAEGWLESTQKDWAPAQKAEAYCILAQLAESLRTSGLGDDAIRDQIRPLLRIVTAQ